MSYSVRVIMFRISLPTDKLTLNTFCPSVRAVSAMYEGLVQEPSSSIITSLDVYCCLHRKHSLYGFTKCTFHRAAYMLPVS